MVSRISRSLLPLLVVPFWSVIGLAAPASAQAQTPLTRAVIEALRNTVRLMPNNQTTRPAQRADVMAPGDGLSTGRASLAELRFNDGSLARVGEQVVFWFVPRTRTFRLSNGTMLLLVPPGRGRTQIQTPNVTTGIQGSALFVRYNQETDTTLVGALTDSGIEVFNQDGTQRQPLRAGQMVVVVENRIERLFNFDLETFYETSDLAQGLDLNPQNLAPEQIEAQATTDPAIAAVQAETSQALRSQLPFSQENVLENPAFVRLSSNSAPNTLLEVQGDLPGRASISAAEVDPMRTDALAIPLLRDRTFIDIQPLLNTAESPNAQPAVIRPADGSTGPDQGNPGGIPGQDSSTDTDGNPQGRPGGFPGQGRGVQDGFPGQGRGVQGGFPGGQTDD